MPNAILTDMKKGIIQVQVIKDDDGYFTASCWDLHAVTQGKTFEELLVNIHEVIELALEDENADVDEFGYSENPSILVSMEMALQHA
jgi:predicted RNase H-like HicB family nuclease